MSDASRANGTIPGMIDVTTVVPATDHVSATGPLATSSGASEEADVIALVEERLSVVKRATVTGRVRVSTRTEIYDDVAEATLDYDVVDVTRVSIGRLVDIAPGVRTEGDTTIVPVIEERLVLVKQLYLKEELHIRHRVESEVSRTPVQLRRQVAVVERLDADGQVVGDPALHP